MRSRPLAVLLAGACERGASGTFAFQHDARQDTLTMRDGQIAVVRTEGFSVDDRGAVAHLGGVIYELGAIDAATLNSTLLEVAQSKKLHGQILLERGAITRERLDEALAEQTFRKVHYLFSLPEEATWTFRENVDELAGARDEDRPVVQTWQAIWRGLRDRPAAPHVLRTLAKIEGSIRLRDLRSVDRFGLAPNEQGICELLATEPTSLAKLVTISPLLAGRTELLVYLLALGRCIVRIEAAPLGPEKLGVDGVRDRAKRIVALDPHTVLGLRPNASAEAARAAYFRQARLWHRARIPAELDAVRAECQQVFERLGEAHRILTRRAAPTIKRASGSSPPTATASTVPPSPGPASAPPSPSMLDVDAALARNDLEEAETIAHTLSSAGAVGPEARAAILWCRIGAGRVTQPEKLEAALASIGRVLTGDPECARALYYRGQILKRLGRTGAATRDFRRVLRIDPHHEGTRRELGLDVGTTAPPGAKPEIDQAHAEGRLAAGISRK